MPSRFRLPTDTQEPQVDPDALREFAAGAKDHRTKQGPSPWEQYDPAELPKYSISIRLNDYHMAMLRHLAQQEDRSQQKILRAILIPGLEEKAGVDS
jgi:hypothetical protein